jgi:hypothetical protein
MSNAKVKVIEIHSGECLYETDLTQIESAYVFAKEMEEHGIEVRLDSPSLPETLGISLGATSDQQAALRQELNDEIDSHDSACSSCVTSIAKNLY